MKYTKKLLPLVMIFSFELFLLNCTSPKDEMKKRFDMQERLLKQPKHVLAALKDAYPQIITSFSYQRKEKDWVLETYDDKKFYWAKGRLLPNEKRGDWQKYKAYVFYYYPEEFIHPEYYPQEYIDAMTSPEFKKERLIPIDYEYSFFNSLYGGSTKADIEKNLVTIKFLNYKINVNKITVQPLKRVETQIMKLNKSDDKEVAHFLGTLKSIFGYNWRLIGDTTRKSNHSWGTAIDILPVNWEKKKVYWMWERSFNKDWFMVPKSSRWCPPDSIIKIFENEGFIWGGKWDLWDNMHFEYRPELLKLHEEFKNFTKSANKSLIKQQIPQDQNQPCKEKKKRRKKAIQPL